MFSSIINLKFPSTAEAKIAASHFSEILGSKISHYDYLGIQITIGKSGELSVCVRFDEAHGSKDSRRCCRFAFRYKKILYL